ncbi:MAG: hypothetical protein JWQ02_2247 [Capsulimonas sp.]|nr:hypothetical protein [Capsulimonas sp.]
MSRLPTYLDRYPAKMVTRLSHELITKYAAQASRIFDPFCGSGSILAAARDSNIPCAGADINPYAILLSQVKLEGFNYNKAKQLCEQLVRLSLSCKLKLPIKWDNKRYWFTYTTLKKYEQIRYVFREHDLITTAEGRAILLAYALSVRRCSRADQRSPKPFISKQARATRAGKHFDPLTEIPQLLEQLSNLYGSPQDVKFDLYNGDIKSNDFLHSTIGSFSHIVTSPPYINAQDYFRNFKLELYLLEELLPFKVSKIHQNFIGTERGNLIAQVSEGALYDNLCRFPELKTVSERAPRLSEVVHRYFSDMDKCFEMFQSCIKPDGVLVIVCGDNLVAGEPIPTWAILNKMLEVRGFNLFDSYGDEIERRLLPPSRLGHKGLIKQEMVSAFRFSGSIVSS